MHTARRAAHAAARAALSVLASSLVFLSCEKKEPDGGDREKETYSPVMEVLAVITDGTFDAKGERVTGAEFSVTVSEGPDIPYDLLLGIDGQSPVRKGVLRHGKESVYRLDVKGDGTHSLSWVVEGAQPDDLPPLRKTGTVEFRYRPFVPGRSDVSVRFAWNGDLSGGVLIPSSGFPEWYPVPRRDRYWLILEYWPESASMHLDGVTSLCEGFTVTGAEQEGNRVTAEIAALSDSTSLGAVVFRFRETEYETRIRIPGVRRAEEVTPPAPVYEECADIRLRVDGRDADKEGTTVLYGRETPFDVIYPGERTVRSVCLVHQGGVQPDHIRGGRETGSFSVGFRTYGRSVMRAEVTMEGGDTFYRDFTVETVGDGSLSLTCHAMDGKDDEDWNSYAVFLYNRGTAPVELSFYSTVYSHGAFGSTASLETFSPSGMVIGPGASVVVGTYAQLESFVLAHVMASFSWHIGIGVTNRWIRSCTLDMTDMRVLIRQTGKNIPIYVNGKETGDKTVIVK